MKDDSPARVGFGLSRATAYRYHAEGVQVLAAQAPEHDRSLGAGQTGKAGPLLMDPRLSTNAENTTEEVRNAILAGKPEERANLIGRNLLTVDPPDLARRMVPAGGRALG